MPNDNCPCCTDVEDQTTEPDEGVNHQNIDTAGIDSELPSDVQSALGQFLGSENVGTLGDWAAEVRRHTGGGSIRIEELCLTNEQTAHWGRVDGNRYYFRCFYDAVILAALTESPTIIRTESPSGYDIEARAVGSDDLTVTPEDAVFSFGIENTVKPPTDGGPTLEDGYAMICPYVKAFPNSEAYSRWAERVPAATVAMPLSGATELAAELVRKPSE